jgi:hypothetical protein
MGSTNNKDEAAGETRIRGGALDGSERDKAADHVEYQQSSQTDKTIRTDNEEDTLYEDGLELDEDSDPLTGINGADDSQRERE